jgi:Tfp pilus assembly protein PilF
MATVFHRSHQLNDAAMHYNEAIRLNPAFAECHTNLGKIALSFAGF